MVIFNFFNCLFLPHQDIVVLISLKRLSNIISIQLFRVDICLIKKHYIHMYKIDNFLTFKKKVLGSLLRCLLRKHSFLVLNMIMYVYLLQVIISLKKNLKEANQNNLVSFIPCPTDRVS